jgi:hypothetical protein
MRHLILITILLLGACINIPKVKGEKFDEDIWADGNDGVYVLVFNANLEGEKYFKNTLPNDSDKVEGIVVRDGKIIDVLKKGEFFKLVEERKKPYIERENEIQRQKSESENRLKEQERLARVAKEEEEEKIKKILREKNLELVYRKDAFVVSKNSQGQYVYIKDGVIKKPIEVKEEINAFEQYLAYQRQLEREMKEIKAKNLAYRWVVQAQAVCPRGYSCWIKSIKENGRNDDGSVRFSISHESRRGSGGGSGVSTIDCGFNKSNTLRSTAVNAVCQ